MSLVSFETNIDAYRTIYDYKFINIEVDDRPCLGDIIVHNGSLKLPPLTIIKIEVIYGNGRVRYKCYLDFTKYTHPDLMKDILNHMHGG